MKETKIDWCDYTINPVIGCKRGCPYCYAKKLNDRFHFVKDFSVPEIKWKSFKTFHPKKKISIFFDSMSDFEYWSDQDISMFHSMIMESTGMVSFIGLTKSPEAISRFRKADILSEYGTFEFPDYVNGSGLWIGYTIDGKAQVDKAIATNRPIEADFLSVEPLECDLYKETNFIDVVLASDRIKLIIIGAETGNRVGKVECKKEWVDSIVNICDFKGIKVFMKSSLKETMGTFFRQDKLPWPCKKQNK